MWKHPTAPAMANSMNYNSQLRLQNLRSIAVSSPKVVTELPTAALELLRQPGNSREAAEQSTRLRHGAAALRVSHSGRTVCYAALVSVAKQKNADNGIVTPHDCLLQAMAAQQVELQLRGVEDAIRGKLAKTREMAASLQVVA